MRNEINTIGSWTSSKKFGVERATTNATVLKSLIDWKEVKIDYCSEKITEPKKFSLKLKCFEITKYFSARR
jgi:hypothetical protein